MSQLTSENSGRRFGRRNVLKISGAALAASTGVGTVGAVTTPPTAREVFMEGLEIREESGNQQAFENYITNRGWNVRQKARGNPNKSKGDEN